MALGRQGQIAYLRGDLTQSGVTQSIVKSLAASLQKTESKHEKIIRIDCKKIRTVDNCGLQLLYVWMQCAKLRGVESELVNLPDSMQQTMRIMGLEQGFTGNTIHLKTESPK